MNFGRTFACATNIVLMLLQKPSDGTIDDGTGLVVGIADTNQSRENSRVTLIRNTSSKTIAFKFCADEQLSVQDGNGKHRPVGYVLAPSGPYLTVATGSIINVLSEDGTVRLSPGQSFFQPAGFSIGASPGTYRLVAKDTLCLTRDHQIEIVSDPFTITVP